MNKFIVTTTINPPTPSLIKFSRKEGWTLIVVGDIKTPHEAYEKFPCIYLHPDKQKAKYPDLSDAIGFNCIQRRNIGFVEAYKMGAEIIATVDDDNIPDYWWGREENLHIGKNTNVKCYEIEEEVFDPLSVTEHSNIWHRGFPLQLVSNRRYNPKQIYGYSIPLVQANLWNGDPDVDAYVRILNPNLDVLFKVFSPYTTNRITPFNSQNTFLSRKVFPHYAVLPHIGRLDDIWGAYLLQKEMDCTNRILFANASVYQARNPHDLMKDAEKEVIGLHTLDFIRGKYELPDATKRFLDVYKECF